MDKLTIVSIISNFLTILTLFGGIIFLILLFLLLYRRKKVLFPSFQSWINKHAMLFSFIVAFLALIGSLFYSDYALYEPCKLCWFQRIFIYPISFLLLIAMIIKDKLIYPYMIFLAGMGSVIAFYHYLLQLGLVSSTSCDVVGYSAACSGRFVLKYGYITIPMMALTACLLVILFLTAQYMDQKKKG